MKKLLLVAIMLCFGCAYDAVRYSETQTDTQLFRIRAVTRIGESAQHIAHGTGFLVETKYGLSIITAAHVLAGGYDRLEFQDSNRNKLPIKYGQVRILPNDIAVIEVRGGAKNPYRTAADPNTGAQISATGFPSAGDQFSPKGTVVDRRYKADIDFRVGMSGGPVFNSSGEVIGMVSLIKTINGETFGIISPISDLN